MFYKNVPKQGWRNFLRTRAQVVYKFRRDPFTWSWRAK